MHSTRATAPSLAIKKFCGSTQLIASCQHLVCTWLHFSGSPTRTAHQCVLWNQFRSAVRIHIFDLLCAYTYLICCAPTHIWSWKRLRPLNSIHLQSKDTHSPVHTARAHLLRIFCEVESSDQFVMCVGCDVDVVVHHLHEIYIASFICHCHIPAWNFTLSLSYKQNHTINQSLSWVVHESKFPNGRWKVVSENGKDRFYRTLLPRMNNYLSFGTAFTIRGLRRILWAFFSNLVIWIIGP